MTMIKVAVLGSGKIGEAIANLLFHSEDYDVTVVDQDVPSLSKLKKSIPVKT